MLHPLVTLAGLQASRWAARDRLFSRKFQERLTKVNNNYYHWCTLASQPGAPTADHHLLQIQDLTMHKFLQLSALSLGLLCSTASLASERPDHYQGKSADTLAEAVSNFSEYNSKLEAILAKGNLSADDLHAIHQLTYTLETALGRINKDFIALGETLEKVHVASEGADTETVQQQGSLYLQTAQQVIR
jgi:hypothetical protein